MLNREGNSIKIRFQKVVLLELEENLQNNQPDAEVNTSEPSEIKETSHSTFGPHPDTNTYYILRMS